MSIFCDFGGCTSATSPPLDPILMKSGLTTGKRYPKLKVNSNTLEFTVILTQR
jgi:hypothetical protein